MHYNNAWEYGGLYSDLVYLPCVAGARIFWNSWYLTGYVMSPYAETVALLVLCTEYSWNSISSDVRVLPCHCSRVVHQQK